MIACEVLYTSGTVDCPICFKTTHNEKRIPMFRVMIGTAEAITNYLMCEKCLLDLMRYTRLAKRIMGA